MSEKELRPWQWGPTEGFGRKVTQSGLHYIHLAAWRMDEVKSLLSKERIQGRDSEVLSRK